MTQKSSASSARRDFRRQLSSANDKRVIATVECGKCHKKVSSAMRWRCAHCGFDNQRTELYSFLNKCQKCETAPTAVVCPHCEALIFLTDEKDSQFSARKFAEQKKPHPKEDPSQRDSRTHAKEKIRLEREIELAQLKSKLAHAKRRADENKEQTDDEKMDVEIRAYVARIMGQHKAIGRAKEQAAEDYKDDADGLEKVMMALEQWREVHVQP